MRGRAPSSDEASWSSNNGSENDYVAPVERTFVASYERPELSRDTVQTVTSRYTDRYEYFVKASLKMPPPCR